MGAQISGLIQGIMYGGDTEKIWFRVMRAGLDVTAIKTAEKVKITIYNPSGDVALAQADMTQSGSTAWWYYLLDASGTTTWDYGYNYRAQLDWIDSSDIDQRDTMLLDVVAQPFNDPIISSTQFDAEHPSWSRARDANWTDWSTCILVAHLELMRDLREMRDNHGDPVYPTRVLDRGMLERVEMAYAERVAVNQGMRADEKMRGEYSKKAIAAFRRLSEMYLDSDDDQVIDEGEESNAIGIQFVR